jgi:hypothetical protein
MKMKNIVLLGAILLLLVSAYQPAQAGVNGADRSACCRLRSTPQVA